MKHEDRRSLGNCRKVSDVGMPRRAVLEASTMTVLGLLSRSALGGEQGQDARDAIPETTRRRMEESQGFMERMSSAGPEERRRIMQERMAARQQRAIENLKEELGSSDAEWRVVKPRLETVYGLVHPVSQGGTGDASSRSELQQKMLELRELLDDKGADVDRVKAALAAVRAAKERANQKLAAAQQSLRQLMTVRQEATLVLSGLLA